jgi:hypothetical protein
MIQDLAAEAMSDLSLGVFKTLLVLVVFFVFARGQAVAQTSEPGTPKDMDGQAMYQAAKVDLKAGRAAEALEKLKAGLRAGVEDRELEWTYRLAVAVAYDQLGKPVAALEATRRFVLTLDVAEGALTETWRTRREGMRNRARDLEGRILETFGALSIESEPSGARIYIDGVPAGVDGDLRAPFVLYLTPGRHKLRLELVGRLNRAGVVDIVPGRVVARRLELVLAPKTATLLVEAGAEEAVVLIDGERAGQGEHVTLALEPGQRAVRVERPGYEAFEEEVTLQFASAGATVLRVPWPEGSSGAFGTADEAVSEQGPGSRRRALDPLWGWIAGGSGLAVMLSGLPLSLMAMSDQDSMDAYQYRPPTEDNKAAFADLKASMHTKEVAAGVLYGVGGAAVVGGAVWLMLAYNQDVTGQGHEGGLSFHVTPLPGGAAMSLGGRW